MVKIYYNITWRGGGGSRDPKFELRNIWTAPYNYWSTCGANKQPRYLLTKKQNCYGGEKEGEGKVWFWERNKDMKYVTLGQCAVNTKQ